MSTDSTNTTAAAGPVLSEGLGLTPTLVERLRKHALLTSCDPKIAIEAADEIERLRTALESAAIFARDILQHVADVLPEA